MLPERKPSRHVRFMRAGELLRVQGNSPFKLHWSSDNWQTANDTDSHRNALNIDYVDLKEVIVEVGTRIHFTLFWKDDDLWEGRDYEVAAR